MRRILISCALCALACCAGAQAAVEPHAQAPQREHAHGWLKSANAGTVEAKLGDGSRSALLDVAARDPAGMQTAGVAQHKQEPVPEPEPRHRTSTAMLIAALAVMSAIALRRLGASDL